MARTRHAHFPTIRTEGAILPADLLERIAAGDRSLPGLTPADYHLDAGEKLNEAVSRSWNRLLGLWKAFRTETAALPADDPGTTHTRERWLLPLFRELGYGRLPAARAADIAGKSYPISHRWNAVPIHLLGCRVDLDRRSAGIAGAARTSPHGLLQEYLNRSHAHLWAFLANGLRLRILRDSARLTRQAYVEFDLESMMDGEVFPDFTLLWLLCHQSRVEGEKPEECLLERWSKAAAEEGARALDALRGGVERAIAALGRGFLAHPLNTALRDDLRSGRLDTQEYFRQLLRLVYRLIFLFVAEDRDLLLAPGADPAARERYLRHYSTRRLRDLAGRTRGSRHADLYEGFKAVADRLENAGSPELALKPLGSFLWSRAAVAALQGCVGNADFLDALRALAWRETGGALRPVDYRNLRGEELGSVYESLLELRPEMHLEAATFSLVTLPGHERKTSGSYYTHDSLVQCLLDSALEPVVEEAIKSKSAADAEKAILSLKVCDLAVGSGHFLVAAAHRLARRLASVRTGDSEPSPEAYRTALRDVIGHCLYGVDLNPMAVELCKVSLWMEAMDPGKPLSFLDHRILCGNSLLGATPALIAKGIPDEAFNPIEGDDKTVASALKKRNKQERAGQMNLFDAAEHHPSYNELRQEVARINALDDTSLDAVRAKETRYRELLASSEYHRRLLEADAWCAAFVWKKTADAPGPLTQDLFLRIKSLAPAVGGGIGGGVPPGVVAEIQRLAVQYRFFHLHLAFPEVFCTDGIDGREIDKATGWAGGFDLALGNPPWDQVQFREQEFFAAANPEIARAQTEAKRRRLIETLKTTDGALYLSYLEARRTSEGIRDLLQDSGLFPLTGRGRSNTFALFSELGRRVLSERGRLGCVVPSGIATDDTTKFFFQDVTEKRSLVSLFDFENRAGLFPDVDSRMKFCLFTCGRGIRSTAEAAEFVFFAHAVEDLSDPERHFTLSAKDIALLNPNTRTCPIFRSRWDAELTKAIYHRVPVLIREAGGNRSEQNTWGIVTRPGLFNMASDSAQFKTANDFVHDNFRLAGNLFSRAEERYFPLYEGKMFTLYDHRFAGVRISETAEIRQGQPDEIGLEGHLSPEVLPLPRFWVSEDDLDNRVGTDWDRDWIPGWKEITSTTNERTLLPCVLPRTGIGHKIPIFLPESQYRHLVPCLVSSLSSFACDYVVRQKLGTTSLTPFTFKQLPVPKPHTFPGHFPWLGEHVSLEPFLLQRVLEVTYTAWDLAQFAKDYGWSGPPFRWDEERRFLLRCELDAAFFHLYLSAETNGDWRPAENETVEELARLKASFPTPRDAVAYIMDTFPIVKRKDEAAHGEYRTKRVILEIYGAMAEAARTGISYQTRLDPPPADPRCTHPNTPPTWLTATAHAETPAPPRSAQAQLQPVLTVPPATHMAPPVFAAEPPLPAANVTHPQAPFTATGTDPIPSVLDYLKANPGPRAKSEILAAISIPDTTWPDLSRRLATHPDVEKTGERRGTRYSRHLR